MSLTPPPGTGGAGAAGRTVLVVEDDDAIRETLCEILALEGHRARGAVNGQAALDLLADGYGPDVILLDLMMPVVDGWEFCRRRDQDPELAEIPVIVLTGVSRIEDSPVPPERTFRKPIDVRRLLAAVRAI